VTIVGLAQQYYEARPLDWRNWSRRPTGTKLDEESQELIDALSVYNSYEYHPEPSPDVLADFREDISDEIADVAICLAWIAQCHDVDIEEAIRAKTEKDRGRGVKDDITT
jgi:NTP pyrophosphatase (non-canonical NTP hydrolase)